MLVYYKADSIIIISLNVTCSRHDIAEQVLIWSKTTMTHPLGTLQTTMVHSDD